MGKHGVADVAVAIVFVALALVITRPGSQAVGIIRSVGGGFAGAIGAATGAGSGPAPRRRGR